MKRVAVPEKGAELLFGTHDENLRFLEQTLKVRIKSDGGELVVEGCLLYTSPSPRDQRGSRMPSSA